MVVVDHRACLLARPREGTGAEYPVRMGFGRDQGWGKGEGLDKSNKAERRRKSRRSYGPRLIVVQRRRRLGYTLIW